MAHKDLCQRYYPHTMISERDVADECNGLKTIELRALKAYIAKHLTYREILAKAEEDKVTPRLMRKYIKISKNSLRCLSNASYISYSTHTGDSCHDKD